MHGIKPFTHNLAGGVLSQVKSEVVGTNTDNRMVLNYPNREVIQDDARRSRALVPFEQTL